MLTLLDVVFILNFWKSFALIIICALLLTIIKMSSTVDYTYNFCMQRFSVLDHFIVSSVVF